MPRIETIEQLEAIYGDPNPVSLIKETAKIISHYKQFIEASPFCALATIGDPRDSGMMDCTPRGDVPGFVRVHDERTLMMPDRRGNNRVDSLRNIVSDPRVGLCFIIPGSTNCLRVNGEAHLSIDPDLLESFAVNGKPPRSVIVIRTSAVYFQCGRAIVRSKLRDAASQNLSDGLPTAGEILAWFSDNKVGGPDYDAGWDKRAKKSLW